MKMLYFKIFGPSRYLQQKNNKLPKTYTKVNFYIYLYISRKFGENSDIKIIPVH